MRDKLALSMHKMVKKGSDNSLRNDTNLVENTDLGIWIKNELRYELENLVELEISRQPPETDLELIIEIVKESDQYQKGS
jgi:hypothetical protein